MALFRCVSILNFLLKRHRLGYYLKIKNKKHKTAPFYTRFSDMPNYKFTLFSLITLNSLSLTLTSPVALPHASQQQLTASPRQTTVSHQPLSSLLDMHHWVGFILYMILLVWLFETLSSLKMVVWNKAGFLLALLLIFVNL